GDASSPLGPAPSLPGTRAQPVPGFHSHTSPVVSPCSNLALTPAPAAPCQLPRLRLRKFVSAKPPFGRTATLLPETLGGDGAQPIQVIAGFLPRASTSKISTDSRSG